MIMPEIDEAELTALRASAARATEIEGKLKEFETDSSLINWKKSREKEKRLLAVLEGQGKKVDEDGNVIDVPAAISQEEIRKMASEEAQKTLIERSLAQAKRDLNDADKVIFDKFYSKAAFGETVDADSVDTIIDTAMRMATNGGGMTAADRIAGTRGGAPRVNEVNASDFSETDAGKGLMSAMFPGRVVKTS